MRLRLHAQSLGKAGDFVFSSLFWPLGHSFSSDLFQSLQPVSDIFEVVALLRLLDEMGIETQDWVR